MKVRINKGKNMVDIYGISEKRGNELMEKVAEYLDDMEEYDELVKKIYEYAKNCKEVGYMLNYALIFIFGSEFDRMMESGMSGLSEMSKKEHDNMFM